MTTVVTPSEKRDLRKIITASSVGTLIEWYDFYIFGSLSLTLSQQFFPKENPTAAFLATLATFAAGFIVRPFGALVFGRLGDRVGRKYTFLVTLITMGLSTFAIGLVPGYGTIGMAAPVIVLILRLVQGLALGGEYGGAATYVAEHAPAARRGYYTSFIQTTATLGFFVSLIVILIVRQNLDEAAFNNWGWRIPFLISVFLVGISVYIRLRMKESPLFEKIKAEGKISKNPIKESFGKKENLKLVLIALFGLTAGQGVVWYTSQFYALSFIQNTCKVDFTQSYVVIAVALLIGTPLFVFFGNLSDSIGRKYIMISGMALAVICYTPIYEHMYELTDISKKKVLVEPPDISYSKSPTTTVQFEDGTKMTMVRSNDGTEARSISLSNSGFWMMVFLVFIQLVFVTMVYGPIAAYLVEMFPTRIRYTSMSLPYHLGNGVFGGLTPLVATSLYVYSQKVFPPDGNPFIGLLYPMAVAIVSIVVGSIFLSNKLKGDIED